MKVAITGGSGVVGGALLRLLVSDGHEVRALSRNGESADALASSGAEPVAGDILDGSSLDALVEGCQWVFNVAGVNQMCVEDPSHMLAVNVQGVREILDACRRGGVSRLTHTSSAATIGERRGTVGEEQSTHRGYFLSEYERSKYLGEKALFDNSDGIEVVSVNPSSVQGPGRASGTGKLILDVVKGDLPFLVDTWISLVDIDDCARGHLRAAEAGEPGRRYLLSGPPVSTRDALRLVSDAVGRDLDVRVVPGSLASAAAAVMEPAAKLVGRDLPFCREMVRVLRFGHRYDSRRAREELGLEFTPLAETISKTMEWFQASGLLQMPKR